MDQSSESYHYLKSAVRIMKQHWFIFFLSTFLFIGLALFLNWYMQPVYEVGSTILIEEEPVANKPDPSKEFMKSFSIFSETNDIQMEILKLKSISLIYKALENIHAHISYYAVTGIRTEELYTDSPFKIDFISDHVQAAGIRFRILPLSPTRFRLLTEKNDDPVYLCNYPEQHSVVAPSFQVNKEYNYGDTIRSSFYSFRISCKKEKLWYHAVDTKYFFLFNDLNMLAYTYQKEIKVEQLSKDVHAASIKIKSKNVRKGIDFINSLTTAYLQHNMDKKNFLAENTIQYLDKQLRVIEDSLNLTENNLQQFRSTKKIMEMAPKSDQEFKSATELEEQKEELKAKSEYYHYIKSSLDNSKDQSALLVPSSMGLDDNVLTGLIEEYIKFNNERNNLIEEKQTRSPFYKSLTIKIKNQKATLSENVNHLIHTNNLLLASIGSRLKNKNKQITELPVTQREMVGIERKYKLNDNLYNYLLQKKAEAEVAKASNIQENDILETARLLQPKPVFPDKTLNLGLGIIIGFLVPFAGYGLSNFMDQTVQGEQMVSSLTQIPFLGRIYHKRGRKPLSVLMDAPKSAISESIRTVRTNLDHFLKGEEHQVILLTSSLPGEGKSFTALNLATSMALLGRKTILLSFDIRKPGVYPLLNQECQLGITSLLSGRATIDEVLETTSIPLLDFIGSGPVLPNPSELIGSVNTAPLLAELRSRYAYVFIDTPPLGLVTDALLLVKYADLKIFIVRDKHTPRAVLSHLLKELEVKDISQFFWLLNDVDAKETFYGKKSEYFSQD
jgi:tyrosine-protein kinase Etk/Wzc